MALRRVLGDWPRRICADYPTFFQAQTSFRGHPTSLFSSLNYYLHTMSKPQILVVGEIFYSPKEVEELSKEFEFIPYDSSSREEFFTKLASPEWSKISAIYRHGFANSKIGTFDAELISRLPASVKYISSHGAGYDDCDVPALTKRGIQLSHTPAAVDNATADVGMFLILAALRQFYKAEIQLRKGEFKNGTKIAHDPEDKVLGIIGMGGIGRALAKRARAFDMKIQYHNRKPVDASLLAEFPEGSIKYVPTLEEILKTSDVLSLNLPLNEHTKNLISTEQFALMKDGAVIVNTARGGVIDEEALLAALDSGKLFSAGLDVFPDEPNVNPKLIANEKVALLPHMGTETVESRHGMEVVVLNNLKSALTTGKFINLVPEQKDVTFN